MSSPPQFRPLTIGEPAPWFRQRSGANPNFTFDTIGGRYVVLAFLGAGPSPERQAALEAVRAATDVFDDVRACFFAVTTDPQDPGRLKERYPGYRFFFDHDCSVSRLYGAQADEGSAYRRFWMVLDPTLRIMHIAPFGADAAARVIQVVRSAPAPERFTGRESFPPVLVLPNVLEPAICQALIDVYEKQGSQESGFMREDAGKTVLAYDDAHKRRRDCILEDPKLIGLLQTCVRRRIVPEIAKVFQFQVTRMERYLVGCYRAEDGGHFRAHRDNTTKGTAHRRFAVTINLNNAFEGGELSFPEYGPRSFKPAPGEAVVFSCSLLHAVSKVTSGARFAFLPFLYDDAAAAIREQNNAFLGEGVGEYRS